MDSGQGDRPQYLVQTYAIQFFLSRYEFLKLVNPSLQCNSRKVFLTSCLKENVIKGAFVINSALKCRHLPSFYSA